jgi:hypothetical protein
MPNPSLLIVPARFKTGRLYSQIPSNTDNRGDFNVTRATAATRVNSAGLIESVASGIPRLDYFASGGVVGCPALLVEPAATNTLSGSVSIDTGWISTNEAQTSGIVSPSGSNNASLFEAQSTTTRVRQTATLASGSTYTFSCFGKFGALSSGFSLNVFDENVTSYGSGVVQAFNLNNGTLGSSGTVGAGFTLQSVGMEDYGNGWYRCRMTVLMGYTPTTPRVGFRIGTAISGGRPLSVVSGTVNVWGAQLETGSVATSYIPTTTGSVTRNADVISVSGAVSGSIGQTEGTIYLETDALISGASDLFSFARATTNTVSITKNSSNIIQATVYTSGPSPALNIAASGTVSGNLKIAVAYKTGESALYINGVQIGTSSTAFSFTAALTQININPTGFFEGIGNQRIRTLSLYTTRLTNAQLAALTT